MTKNYILMSMENFDLCLSLRISKRNKVKVRYVRELPFELNHFCINNNDRLNANIWPVNCI